jgi:hypothetical protein
MAVTSQLTGKYSIFLSHSSVDKNAVRRLANDLETEGFSVWLDEWEIFVGQSIVHRISQGIEHSEFIAVWLTNNAVNSGWVQREWYPKFHDEISSGQVRVLPLLAEVCEIPIFLKDKRYANFQSDYNKGLRELLETLRALIIWDQTILESYIARNIQKIGSHIKKLNEGEYEITCWLAKPFWAEYYVIIWNVRDKALSRWLKSGHRWHKDSENLSSEDISRIVKKLA